MPTLTITDDDVIAVAYSSVTEGYATSDNRYNYRHNWVTFSPDLGNTWGLSVYITEAIVIDVFTSLTLLPLLILIFKPKYVFGSKD